MAMLAIALRGTDDVFAVFDHHWVALSLGCHSCGRRVGCAAHSALRFQILLMYYILLIGEAPFQGQSGRGARWRMHPSPFLQAIKCPNAVLCDKPNEELAFCDKPNEELAFRDAHVY